MGDDDAAAAAAASYIRLVQHLIERCLIFGMSREECVDAIAKNANIEPVITATVWKELEKENRDFFESYAHGGHDAKGPEQAVRSVCFRRQH